MEMLFFVVLVAMTNYLEVAVMIAFKEMAEGRR
jgi:hypothetical protein